MMRISSPEVIWPQRLFKRIHKMQEKAEQRSRCRQEKQEKKEEAAGNATATGTGVPPPPPPFFGRGRECLEVAEEVAWEEWEALGWEEWELDVGEWEGEEANGTGSGLELQVPGLAPPLRP